MKSQMKCLILLFISHTVCSAQQGLGVSLSYATRKVFSVDMFYEKNGNAAHLGYSNHYGGQKSTTVTRREDNYGLTPIGSGNYFWLVDLAYSRRFLKIMRVQAEVNLGKRLYFTSYKDNRFKDDGYSLITKTDGVEGVGVNLGVAVNRWLEFYSGYGTLKGVVFGVRAVARGNEKI